MDGRLLLLATPIGNLGDATPRLRDALAAAEVIACEDTRRLAKLLAHLGVSRAGKEVITYTDYNEQEVVPKLWRRLQDGKTVALITDAGTPLVADPGYRLVKKAIDAAVPVGFIPGPSAVHAALVLSGLPPYPYTFLGYLPRRCAERRAFLKKYEALGTTAVVFLTPHRLTAELEDIREVWGDRPAALGRELTKVFEEVIRGKLGEIREVAAGRRLKGEMTLVVAATEKEVEGDVERAVMLARALVAEGVPPAKAAAAAARAGGANRQAVYRALNKVGR